MTKLVNRTFWLVLAAALLAGMTACDGSNAGGPDVKPPDEKSKKGKAPRPFARLFIQDLKTSSLKWADVRVGEKAEFTLDPLAAVDGFKALDAAKQKLVQMEESGGLVCAGVRDDADGTFESGWVLVRSGVGYIDHGDHGHWTFKKKPAVADSRLDTKQGNPAHLYQYDGRFFLANDKLNGYTRIDPAKYDGSDKDTPRFVAGGGGHITLAVVGDTVGYGGWIDGGGPNKGRVDVTPVEAGVKNEPAYSFHLPTGGIHGAIANSGKVFFAPSDGVCWVEADTGAKLKADQVKVRHIPLGKDGDKPRRTGAFASHGHHVVFVTGKDANSALVLVNAKDAEPKPVFVPLKVKKGTQAVTPVVAATADGKAYAFVFHDRVKDAEADDALEVVALDPNGDGDFSDAKAVKALKAGKSAVDGHYGHHDLAFDADRRFGFFTNPGDGTVCVLSLKTLDVLATFHVGGTPTAIVACGSRETED
ncbi:YncE family protein [Limnoglobus roseus]|uniref:Lipoprotein n=1 Tax=Limnoglobus roseus TaxID=2598579 RepID=A0A5C1AAR2_9BACT|nr:hypothetical protein [Limnoglobus roseus]QEL15106.1 hypothetical protein PX52LOC_02015 [Limnoglobus roseus]